MKLRAVTINVWSGFNYQGLLRLGEYESPKERESRYQILLSNILKLDPDILVLNEANLMPDYAARITKDTGMNSVWHLGVSGLRVGKVGLPVNLREADVILTKPGVDLQFIKRVHLGGRGIVNNFFSFHFGNLTQAFLASAKINNQTFWIFQLILRYKRRAICQKVERNCSSQC